MASALHPPAIPHLQYSQNFKTLPSCSFGPYASRIFLPKAPVVKGENLLRFHVEALDLGMPRKVCCRAAYSATNLSQPRWQPDEAEGGAIPIQFQMEEIVNQPEETKNFSSDSPGREKLIKDSEHAEEATWQLSLDANEQEGFDRRFKLRNGREVLEERAYLIGVEMKGAPYASSKDLSSSAATASRWPSTSVQFMTSSSQSPDAVVAIGHTAVSTPRISQADGGASVPPFSIQESLEELAQLANTAGLMVVGSTYQRLEKPNPRTYIGEGKVAELKAAITASGAETVIFDDELSPRQSRNLEKELGKGVRVCDRSALILDIFSQRAATREANLQVEMAQAEYQLPRLTRMWTHLERQAGGLVKGMGEKQIEIDKRILRSRISGLRRELESVRGHRQLQRNRRAAEPVPVASLVGYTNAGKSTLMNRLSRAGVLAEDRLFATLDPTTRRVELPNGKAVLLSDTVGFIQKLPTQLIAAFRATLEEISDASLLLHVVDISHPMAEQQMAAVHEVLADLDVENVPMLTVWNKIDNVPDVGAVRKIAAAKENVVCISAKSGVGIEELLTAIETLVNESLVLVEVLVPHDRGDVLNAMHSVGAVTSQEYVANGVVIQAHVPPALAQRLLPWRRDLKAWKTSQMQNLSMNDTDNGAIKC